MKRQANGKSTASRGKSRGGMLVGVFVGLVLGVLIAFGVVWYLNKTPLPFQEKSYRPERKDNGGQPQAPLALPGKPGDKVSERGGEKGGDKGDDKPRFEFYKILPGGQEAPPQAAAKTPEKDKAADKVADKTADKAVAKAPADRLYLQAGAFQKAADADNLKAKLAMMGVEAGVQEVEVPDKGKMTRVRVGPFASPEEMNLARNQLSQSGIQATVVRIKE